MEMTSRVISEGMQVIVLIPEIALTYRRSCVSLRSGSKPVSTINSRLLGMGNGTPISLSGPVRRYTDDT